VAGKKRQNQKQQAEAFANIMGDAKSIKDVMNPNKNLKCPAEQPT